MNDEFNSEKLYIREFPCKLIEKRIQLTSKRLLPPGYGWLITSLNPSIVFLRLGDFSRSTQLSATQEHSIWSLFTNQNFSHALSLDFDEIK